MSKLDGVLDKCKAQMEKCNIPCDEALLKSIAKGLGPSIYNRDSLLVAASDKTESDNIKKKFIVGKLGCKEGAEADKAFDAAVQKIGKSNTNKLRPVFYYILVKDLGKESIYA